MNSLTLERTLLYRSNDGQLTRYEIFKTDDNSSNNIDSIIVFREALCGEHLVWVRTNDEISLEHLGFSKDVSFQSRIQTDMRASRDISSAIDECNKHWSQNYR